MLLILILNDVFKTSIKNVGFYSKKLKLKFIELYGNFLFRMLQTQDLPLESRKR